MKKMKLPLWTFGLIPSTLTPLLVISCSNNSNDKKDPDPNKIKPDKKQEHNFLKEIVDESWEDIDVNVKTFDEWLQVKNMYEKKIIELNDQNLNLDNYDNLFPYYKNKFYIAWYLRIIGKANKNLSWLKFSSLYPDISENEDLNANFTYALYFQNHMGYLWSRELKEKIQDFYFHEMVEYQTGNMLTKDFFIPKNYLNFDFEIIESKELQVFLDNQINIDHKQKLSKVFDYFSNKQDVPQFKELIEYNNKFLEKRWNDRIWTHHPLVTDDTYFDWLATKDIFRPFSNEISFKQIKWKEWIDSKI